MQRLLICGSRTWTNKELIRQEIIKRKPKMIIEGEAEGADTLAREVARELGLLVRAFPANWEVYGKAAGPIRNKQMIIEGKPNFVLAFHNDIENSKGTKNMIAQAAYHKIKYEVIKETS